MHWRTILVLLLVLAALGGFLWWKQRAAQVPPPALELPLVAGFDAGRLASIEVDHRIRGLQVRLELDARQRWRIVDPLRDAAADAGVVAALIEVARSGLGIAQPAADAAVHTPAKLGLEPPRARVRFTERAESGAEQRRELLLGALDIDGRGMWVQAGGRVLHTSRALDALLDRNLDDYRERRALDVDPSAVTAIRRECAGAGADPFASEAAPFDAAVDGIVAGFPIWRVRAPRAVALDPLAVSALLRSACVLPVVAFVDEAPADLARYGLDAPRFSIALELGDGATRTLDFGRFPGAPAQRAAEGDWLCRERGSGPVWRVDTRDVGILAAALENLLDYRLLRAERASITRLALESWPAGAAAPVALELAALNGRWFTGEPGRAPRADGARVEDLLGRLEGIELPTYLPALAPSELVRERALTVWAGDERVCRFEFGAPHATSSASGRLALRDGDAVLVLAPAELDALLDPALALWRTREVWKHDELALSSIEVSAGLRKRVYVRDGADGTWRRDGARGPEARELEPVWLERALSIQAAEWLEGPAGELAEVVELALTEKDGSVQRLVLGRGAGGAIELELDGARARPKFPELHAALLRWLAAP
ncbi:MAG: DUF4340 domain-containing protein [Planctomycetota bacterium]|nr:MAG: DUF4340 domain-containing protein [Planctomycetota bacterium]